MLFLAIYSRARPNFMADEIPDPLDAALWAPKPLKLSPEEVQECLTDSKTLSDVEYQNLLIQVQKKLVEYGTYISDLNTASFHEVSNIIIRLIEGKGINKRLQRSKISFEEGAIDHDAIEANSTDIHEFSFEAIEAKKVDALIKELIILMQHAAAQGKYALLVPGGSEPIEEYMNKTDYVKKTPIPFLHRVRKKEENSDQENKHELP